MKKCVGSVMKGCVERTSSAHKCRKYLFVCVLMKISVELDTRCEIYFIIYRLPKREPCVNVNFNRKFIACYMFS